MMKRTQEDVECSTPTGKRRLLQSNLQLPTSYDSASLEDTDAEMLDHDHQGDLTDDDLVCYGAVSSNFH